MEINFSDQNEADIAAKRDKILARLTKRRALPETTNSVKNSAKELDDLIQKAIEEVEAKRICPDTIENLERMLPSSSGRVLKRIQDTLEELRKIELAQSKPQKSGGFSFAKKSAPSTPMHISSKKEIKSVPVEIKNILAPVSGESALEIFDKENSSEEVNGVDGTSVSLKNLKNCNLYFTFSPSAVHMKNVSDCNIRFSVIESSILMHETIRSKIFAIAQQIRVHDSTDIELHVAVKGAVILEGCKNVGMAPYRLMLNGSNINESDGDQWKKPLDFDWLSAEPSPNWRLLEESSWVKEELL